MSQHYKIYADGILSDFGTTTWPDDLITYMNDNIDYTNNMISAHAASDPWWRQAGYVVAHTNGILDGYHLYQLAGEQNISYVDMWIYQSAGDMDDISLFISPSNWVETANGKHIKAPSDQWYDTHHHCSGMVFLPSDSSDIYFAQDSWSAINTMNRVLKEYDFQLTEPSTASTKWTFSSHPGLGYSMDDFWELDSDLLVLETTLHNWNTTLYELYCTPRTILCWLRVQIANRMSSDGRTWCSNFIRENSGTYNNQYFVVDTKKFTPGTKPTSGLLWAIEQLPGEYEMGDRTAELVANTYVPSYNTPFFTKIYNDAGYPEKVEETQSNYWTYWNNSRMLITERDFASIDSYEAFKSFMRYNDWENDPLSNEDPAESIQSRYDLRPDSCIPSGTMNLCPSAFAGLDAKTTNYQLSQNLMFDAISSPQYETQPVWVFGVGKWADVEWDGLPQVWKFPWIQFAPDK